MRTFVKVYLHVPEARLGANAVSAVEHPLAIRIEKRVGMRLRA